MREERSSGAMREGSDASSSARDVMGELTRETEREILEILIAESPLGVMEIAKTAEHHPITVDQTCARLHEKGYIHSRGRGRYEVTENGVRQIGDGCD